MATTAQSGPWAALIHEGWNHLKSQRPLAAWGSWQRVLRSDPESVVAKHALAALESAADLPRPPAPPIASARPPIPPVGRSGIAACVSWIARTWTRRPTCSGGWRPTIPTIGRLV